MRVVHAAARALSQTDVELSCFAAGGDAMGILSVAGRRRRREEGRGARRWWLGSGSAADGRERRGRRGATARCGGPGVKAGGGGRVMLPPSLVAKRTASGVRAWRR